METKYKGFQLGQPRRGIFLQMYRQDILQQMDLVWPGHSLKKLNSLCLNDVAGLVRFHRRLCFLLARLSQRSYAVLLTFLSLSL
jgi:hypothetical protein